MMWTDESLDGPDAGGCAAPHVLILFGASGDLARRKLLPALYHLHCRGLLPQPFRVVGSARRQLTDDEFRSELKQSIHDFSLHPAGNTTDWAAFAAKFSYCSVDVRHPEAFLPLLTAVEAAEQADQTAHNRLFYLAVAPDYCAPIAAGLEHAGLVKTRGWRRVVTEKPFGHDYASAAALNEALRAVFEEEEIYRIDHYLGKEMVQNIEVLRFANSLFEPVWNNRSIANVQITSSETIGVEDRASYYDHAGALRDMVQNHMLQMVMMVAMEPPSRLKTEAIRDEKVKVLRSLRRFTPDEAAAHVVRGQYGAYDKTTATTDSALQGLAYVQEPGVPGGSKTETFVAARLFVDNFRFAGVPFYLRTGKRLAVKSTEIVIQFRDMPKHLYFNPDGQLGPNLLVIRVNPVEGMYLQLNAKRPGADSSVVPIALEFSQHAADSAPAYERLLHDAMCGDPTFFTRWDEVGLAWKWVDPVAASFANPAGPALPIYASGGWGPAAAEELLRADGFSWWPVYGQETQSVETVLERQTGQIREENGHEQE